MAIINFEQKQTFTDTNAQGPLSDLYKNSYDFRNLFYPKNLGSEKRGHYINFYINVAQNSQYIRGDKYNLKRSEYSVFQQPGRTGINQQGGNTISAVDLSGAINFGSKAASSYYGALAGAGAGAIVGGLPGLAVGAATGGTAGLLLAPEISSEVRLSRKTKRISQAVSLYMPETVNVQYNADWQSSSLTDAGGLALALGQVAKGVSDASEFDLIKTYKTLASDPSTASAAAELFGNIGEKSGIMGPGAKDFFLYATGSALNPQLEVLFKGTEFRTFQFDFIFSPTDATETENVIEIIKTFKFHMSPEINTGLMGRYFTPPSEFDIDFLFNGQKNNKIHQIGTCVLTNVNVDYSPNGWSSFNDGMPTQIRMTLQFMETEIVTKQRVDEDNY